MAKAKYVDTGPSRSGQERATTPLQVDNKIKNTVLVVKVCNGSGWFDVSDSGLYRRETDTHFGDVVFILDKFTAESLGFGVNVW